MFQLTIAVPGLRANDLSATLHCEDGLAVLKLVGQTKCQHRRSKIVRQLQLPADADHESVNVALADGLLTVSVSKKLPTEPQLLSITDDDGIGKEAPGEEAPGYQLTLLVPGMRADELKVTLEHDGVLDIQGETSRRRHARIHRKLKLPRNADVGGAACSLADGVLTVTAPKRLPMTAESRELPVQACVPGECASD